MKDFETAPNPNKVVLLHRESNWLIAICILFGGAIFGLDLMLRLGMAVPVLYIGVVWLAGNSADKRFALWVATVCSLATISGVVLSPPGEALYGTIVINRFLYLFAIWMTTCLLIQRTSQEKKLEQYSERLEERVHERTLELREAHARAVIAERLAAIGEMVTGLAHESRNALQRIQSSVNRLYRRTQGDQEVSTIVADIERAAEDVARLYEEVRAYAAPISLDKRECDLSVIWEKVWDELRASSDSLDITLERKCNDSRPLIVADAYRLEQVFRNLFENAIQAGEEPIRIEIACTQAVYRDREAFRVVLRDDGPGLNTEQREKIFEPFYTTRSKGTGLGMSMVKRIVEGHDGQISIEEPESGGAAFVIMLPKGQI